MEVEVEVERLGEAIRTLMQAPLKDRASGRMWNVAEAPARTYMDQMS